MKRKIIFIMFVCMSTLIQSANKEGSDEGNEGDCTTRRERYQLLRTKKRQEEIKQNFFSVAEEILDQEETKYRTKLIQVDRPIKLNFPVGRQSERLLKKVLESPLMLSTVRGSAYLEKIARLFAQGGNASCLEICLEICKKSDEKLLPFGLLEYAHFKQFDVACLMVLKRCIKNPKLFKEAIDTPSDENYSETPLIAALYEKNIPKALQLIKYGANTTARTKTRGDTPAHAAVLIDDTKERKAVIQALQEKSDENIMEITNHFGKTPQYYLDLEK